ncbi:MAG: ABC transporter ATP-binding protein [Clostridia bacterium]|nr:ABC transporter ATP-binding protein [Clostridia bacterium]
MRRFSVYMKPYRYSLLLCLVLVLIVTALGLLKPILIGNAIDDCITGENAATLPPDVRFSMLLHSALLYAIVLLALFLLSRWEYLIMQETGQKIIYDLRNDLFKHTEGLSMRFFDTTPVGKIVTRITNDAESINEVFSSTLVSLFQNLTKVIGFAAIMLFLNIRMALWSFAALPAAIVLTILFRLLSRRAFRITRNKLTELNTFLSEHISGMQLIQLFAQEKRKETEFRGKSDELYRASYRELLVNAFFRPLIYMVSIFALVIVVIVGSHNVLSGVITIGTLYIFLQYIVSFFGPIEELAEQFSTIQSAIASAEKIFSLFDETPQIQERSDPVRLPAIRGRIEFDHVWFAYQSEDWVLKDVSFVIEPGQRVAFVGATGAGKSSILNLIGRYYDIQRGSIRLDGIDIRDLPLDQLRASIGQVQQDVFLFSGDIRRNIKLLDDISDADMIQAATDVNATRFIDNLPNQYNEPVGERGASLSSGQRQLLSFARTLAHDPAILILDEATSNIDTETEQWIQDALVRLMEGRTSIMVAHRLSTIQHVDLIMVMHHGRIREQGTHQELLAINGIYKKLYLIQLAAEN